MLSVFTVGRMQLVDYNYTKGNVPHRNIWKGGSRQEGKNQFGAWHRLTFPDFQVDVLIEVSNHKARLGAFEGLCLLDNDRNKSYTVPSDQAESCQHLGSLHLQSIIDEILAALGITPESAISAIKWQMR